MSNPSTRQIAERLDSGKAEQHKLTDEEVDAVVALLDACRAEVYGKIKHHHAGRTAGSRSA